jgi:hypothetical protein
VVGQERLGNSPLIDDSSSPCWGDQAELEEDYREYHKYKGETKYRCALCGWPSFVECLATVDKIFTGGGVTKNYACICRRLSRCCMDEVSANIEYDCLIKSLPAANYDFITILSHTFFPIISLPFMTGYTLLGLCLWWRL